LNTGTLLRKPKSHIESLSKRGYCNKIYQVQEELQLMWNKIRWILVRLQSKFAACFRMVKILLSERMPSATETISSTICCWWRDFVHVLRYLYSVKSRRSGCGFGLVV